MEQNSHATHIIIRLLPLWKKKIKGKNGNGDLDYEEEEIIILNKILVEMILFTLPLKKEIPEMIKINNKKKTWQNKHI